MTVLAQTPMHDWHAAHGGRMVDFAGWSMPVQYTSIVREHTATRTAASLFDVSHMGRFYFQGPRAAEFLDSLLTRRVVGMGVGKIRYSLVTDSLGGILDDVLVYYLSARKGLSAQQGFMPDEGEPLYMLVVNAGNREKIADWIHSHLSDFPDVAFTDRTSETAMIAVQGPLALEVLQPLLDFDVSGMKYYTGTAAVVANQSALVSRTGYTGEDGCELVVAADAALEVWETILQQGQDRGVIPAGLGARDTLRLEAAMPLYGHELSEQINPYQAGLSFAVNLVDREFCGCQALAQIKDSNQQLQRVGLQLSGRRVARQHFAIVKGEETVGEVTSGTFSPTLQCPIAMGYVRQDCSKIGTELAIDVRGRSEPARVVELPFYSRTK